jgi:S-adenosylmethionine:tRNA ribosyltransferase-isomerase
LAHNGRQGADSELLVNMHESQLALSSSKAQKIDLQRLDARAPQAPLDFQLPPELEATEPPEARGLGRDGVRLLVSQGPRPQITHTRFREIGAFLEEGDTLVVNTSGTLNAALPAHVGPLTLELHLSVQRPDHRWVVELRAPEGSATKPYRDGYVGMRLELPGQASATLDAPYPITQERTSAIPPRLWLATLDLPTPLHTYLAQYGAPIRYGYVTRSWPAEYYQTVYATEPGSAEMPSAGRAFTPELITRLVATGVRIAPLILHTGVASLEDHEPPYEEYFRVPAATARLVNETRVAGQRVVAVGTTVVRALETVADDAGMAHSGEGWTDLVITPERGVRVVDGLLTGLHEPRASHLAMLEAICGHAHLQRAYAAALRGRYLWHEFGDLHLILPERARGERLT